MNANMTGSSRTWIIVIIACMAVAAVYFLRPGAGSEGADKSQAEVTVTGVPPVPDRVSVEKTTAPRRATSSSPVSSAAGPAGAGAKTAAAEATPETRQLVNNLVQLQVTNGVLTPEQAGTWRTNLAQLATHGATAVPAIREFLDKNMDFDFGAGGKALLGYSTARLALIDVLGQAGGPEAIAALSGTMQVTADPREIAAIARNLEQIDPAAHRQEALDAARQTLAMAVDGKLPDRDVAPLFEVFQNYGDGSVASELAQNSKNWNYYSMFSLAQLPEGAGVPTLVQIVNGEGNFSSGARVPALEMLTQLAGQSDTARAALVAQAKDNKLTPYNWATMESILAGDQVRFQDSAFDTSAGQVRPGDVRRTHISFGNQNFYSAPPAGGLTAEQVQQQNALIDELTKVTTDQNSLQVLRRARDLLARRAGSAAPAPASNP
jgi:hypothetical protein